MKKLSLLLLIPLTMLSSCGRDEKIIKVGASSTPHALILEQTKSYIESKGYQLEITVFNDYVIPNYSLNNGEIDANYFQHEPYLNEFNSANNMDLKSIAKIHFEPMGIYKGTKSSLADYSSSDKIVVPSDKSNYDRAVDLLKLNSMDNCQIVMAEAQMIPLMLEDCSFAVINGNYALSSGVTNKILTQESKDSEIANKMANIIAVKEESEKTDLLVEALKQPNIKTFIDDTFKGSVVYVAE